MGRPPKEFNDDVITEIINTETEHLDNDTRLPSTTEIVERYREETGEEVHQKTFLRYLQRTDRYSRVKIRDYFGWRVEQ